MKITIKHKLFQLDSSRILFINDEELYHINSESFGDAVLKLYHKQTGYVKSIITHESSILKDKYYIRLFTEDNLQLEFKKKSILKNQYECFYNDNKYEIIRIKWDKYLIFKNETEIFYKLKKEKNFFDEEYVFEIEDLNDNNIEFMISIFIIIYTSINNAKNSN